MIASLLALMAAPSSPAQFLGEEEESLLDWRFRPLDYSRPIPYYISPAVPEIGGRTGDPQLARWAVRAWEKASDGALCLYPSPAKHALLRIYWGIVEDTQVGRMQSIAVSGRRGSEVFVRLGGDGPVEALGQMVERDPLYRDVVVYITLVHEIGHALGMVHSISIGDVMYFGGDPVKYYRRYRERISSREDLRRLRILSSQDTARIRGLYRLGEGALDEQPEATNGR